MTPSQNTHYRVADYSTSPPRIFYVFGSQQVAADEARRIANRIGEPVELQASTGWKTIEVFGPTVPQGGGQP